MTAKHVALPGTNSWRAFVLPLCQLCACAIAVPVGFIANATAGSIAFLPPMPWAEMPWLATCIYTFIECSWVAIFGYLALIARRRDARFGMFLCAGLACGALPYAAIWVLILLIAFLG